MVFNSSQHVSHFNLCLPISHTQRPFQLQLSWSRTYLFSSQAQQLVWIDFRHFAWLKGKTPWGLVLNFKLSWYLRPSINHGGCSMYHFKSMTIYLVVLKPSRRFFKNKIFFLACITPHMCSTTETRWSVESLLQELQIITNLGVDDGNQTRSSGRAASDDINTFLKSNPVQIKHQSEWFYCSTWVFQTDH